MQNRTGPQGMWSRKLRYTITILLMLLCAPALADQPSSSAFNAYKDARQFPPHNDKVCVLTSPLPAAVPASPVGRLSARFRGEPTTSEDQLLADRARLNGANVVVVVARNGKGKVRAGAFHVEPEVKLNCIAAGGQLH